MKFVEESLEINPSELIFQAKRLKEDGYVYFSFLTAVDQENKFLLRYRVASLENKKSLILKLEIRKDNPTIDSVTSVWSGADWHEREVYDLFGIIFEGHPDLRRILLPENWQGHSLRKDYQDERIVKRPDFY